MLEEIPGWGHWRRCISCSLQFVTPLKYEGDFGKLYDEAYRGIETANDLQDFAYRFSQRRATIKNPGLWFWTPAYEDVLEWVSSHCSPGATVLDIGCGLGIFLHALRERGFSPIGLDIAEIAVSVNQQDGFRVWHGSVDEIPQGWAEPEAIVSFFMLHHLENPLEVVRTIRARWPSAMLAMATYGPTNYSPTRTAPPRTMIRWSSAALRRLLTRAGYVVEIREFASSGTEARFLRPFGRLIKRIRLNDNGMRAAKRVENRLLPFLVRPLSKPAYVVLALARPADGFTEVSRLSVVPQSTDGTPNDSVGQQSQGVRRRAGVWRAHQEPTSGQPTFFGPSLQEG